MYIILTANACTVAKYKRARSLLSEERVRPDTWKINKDSTE